MITFKQYLTEARMAPLYHGTSWSRIKDILDEGDIKAWTQQQKDKLLMTGSKKYGTGFSPHHVRGVSSTRSLLFAKRWSDHGPIFELDQDAISRRYKIVPLQFFHGKERHGQIAARSHEKMTVPVPNEFEEFIVTSENLPLKYVSKLHLPSSVNKFYNQIKSDTIDTIKSKYPHIKIVEY